MNNLLIFLDSESDVKCIGLNMICAYVSFQIMLIKPRYFASSILYNSSKFLFTVHNFNISGWFYFQL